jgi:hypothetical protein
LQRAALLLSMALSPKPNALIIAGARIGATRCSAANVKGDTAHGEGVHDAAARKPDAALQRRLCESAMWLSAGRLHRLGPFETCTPRTRSPAHRWRITGLKASLSRDKAAFSRNSRRINRPSLRAACDWPEEARRALREAQALAERLNPSLTAYRRSQPRTRLSGRTSG